MHIQNIDGVYHIEDKTIDSVTRDTNIVRAINNATWKHVACKGTENPTREDIQRRKEARTGARLVFIY